MEAPPVGLPSVNMVPRRLGPTAVVRVGDSAISIGSQLHGAALDVVLPCVAPLLALFALGVLAPCANKNSAPIAAPHKNRLGLGIGAHHHAHSKVLCHGIGGSLG